MQMEKRWVRESRCYKTSRVFPPDVNNHNTLFGGKLMAYIDDIASIAATKHCRRSVVTASTDSVDFLHPIRPSDSVCLESFVTWTGKTSMEVFVKVIKEDLLSGERKIAATSFLTFVALDDNKKPVPVPAVVPETEEEFKLHETAPQRAEARRIRREESKKLADYLTVKQPWD
jgi:acyl-CoA hydrolase